MRVVLTSDLHGNLPEVPPCDLLLIAGDICPIEDHELDFQANWLRHQFCDWLQDAPARQKIFIAGNHDFVFAYRPDLVANIRWPGVYLQDSGCQWEGLSFWGSPWANELAGWPFTAPEEELDLFWQKIPRQTHVLLVHGPPYGIGDEVTGRISGDPLHVGSRTLVERLDRLPELRLVVCGHIHEGYGEYPQDNYRIFNAARMDVRYQPIHPLRTVTLD